MTLNVEIIDRIDKFFPYDSYRPNQKNMLEFAYTILDSHGVGIISAPTGSGKSSVVSAVLAYREKHPDKKVLIAVRTVSQLDIFMNELESIRKSGVASGLTFSYIIGKGNICPHFERGSGNIYEMCNSVKEDIKNGIINEKSCKYYLNCYDERNNSDNVSYSGSQPLLDRAYDFAKQYIKRDKISEFCGKLCPYEVMTDAAVVSDIIVVNYYHLISPKIRQHLFKKLGLSTNPPIIIMDEAHNVGNIVEGMNSVSITEINVTNARNAVNLLNILTTEERDNIKIILDEVSDMIYRYKGKIKSDTIFDSNELVTSLLGKLSLSNIDDDKSDVEILKEQLNKYIKAVNSYQDSNSDESITKAKVSTTRDKKLNVMDRVLSFVLKLISTIKDKEYIRLYCIPNQYEEDASSSLKIINIDPSNILISLANSCDSLIMMSGTITPTNAYADIYFKNDDIKLYEEKSVKIVEYPTPFPEENRLVYCAVDVSSKSNKRFDDENTNDMFEYIKYLIKLEVNTAIYFTSYSNMIKFKRMADKEGLSLKYKIYDEDKDASRSNQKLNEFMKLPEKNDFGTLFGVCGGKWCEGIDFKGDKLKAVCVMGLPLGTWDMITKQKIGYYEKKYGKSRGNFLAYKLHAINKCEQALGRVLRTMTDKGVLFLCDDRYDNKFFNYGLSKWILDEMDLIMTNTLESEEDEKIRQLILK